MGTALRAFTHSVLAHHVCGEFDGGKPRWADQSAYPPETRGTNAEGVIRPISAMFAKRKMEDFWYPTDRSRPVSSFAVAGQHVLAGFADLCAVRLQAVQNAAGIIRIDLKLGLAKLDHVGVAGGALALGSLHRRYLSVRGRADGEAKSNGQDCDPQHRVSFQRVEGQSRGAEIGV
ncbi:MAG: hypothetical protein ABSE22_05020 [Xanthobacteraceae bacterium]